MMQKYCQSIKNAVKASKMENQGQERKKIINWTEKKSRLFGILILALIVASGQIQFIAGYEAHVIDVTAHICDYSETRTASYWKNHSEISMPHLPQYLGAPGEDEMIDTEGKVNEVFSAENSVMRNELKKQLLAMKFNIAHFEIGEYFVENEGKILNEIVAQADDLLRQNPEPQNNELESKRNLLNELNNLQQIQYCSTADTSDSDEYVVINEFLPNPTGNDNAPMPGGEWVELYNKGEDINVADWMLYDANDSHTLQINSSNTNTGDTFIPSEGFLVVYRNGDTDFALNNTGGDTVRLYNGGIGSGGTLIDSYAYTTDALEGKSFARIPDGSENWIDPIPTPGEPNAYEGKEIVFGPALLEPGEKEIDGTQKNSGDKAKKANTGPASVLEQTGSETPQVDNNTSIQTDECSATEEITQPDIEYTETDITENLPLEEDNNTGNNQNSQHIISSPLHFEGRLNNLPGNQPENNHSAEPPSK